MNAGPILRSLLYGLSLLLCAAPALSLEALPTGSLKAFALASARPAAIHLWASSAQKLEKHPAVHPSFAPGETAYTGVMVIGYSFDVGQAIDLDAGFRFFDHLDQRLFRRDLFARAGSSFAGKTGFILLIPIFEITFDPTDPPGNYRPEFEIHGNLGRNRTTASMQLTLDPRENSYLPEQNAENGDMEVMTAEPWAARIEE